MPTAIENLTTEYREIFECYMAAAQYLDGDKMPRELKSRINRALDKAAIRFNADALKAKQGTPVR